MTDGVAVAFVSGLFLVATTAAGVWFSRRKNRADFASTLVASAEKLIAPLTARIVQLEAHVSRQDEQIADLQRENEKLRRHNQILMAQVVESGGTPVLWEAMEFLEGDLG